VQMCQLRCSKPRKRSKHASHVTACRSLWCSLDMQEPNARFNPRAHRHSGTANGLLQLIPSAGSRSSRNNASKSKAHPRTIEEHLWRGVHPRRLGAALGDVAGLPVCGQQPLLAWAGLLVGLQRHVVLGVQHILPRQPRQRAGCRRCRRVVDALVVHVVHRRVLVHLASELRRGGALGRRCLAHGGARVWGGSLG